VQRRFVEVEIAAALGPTLQAKEVPSTGRVRAARFPEARVRRVVRSYCSPVAVRAALRTCGKLSNLRRTVTIALVVGCILSIINEGDLILRGQTSGGTAVKRSA